MSVTHQINKGVVSTSGASPLSGSYNQVGASETVVDTTLAASSTNVLVAASYGAGGTSTGNLLSIEITCSQNCTIKTNGTGSADVQTVSISGTPTGGTFALSFGGAITSPIAFNAAAATTVQTALQALSTIGSGNITCTGGPLPGTPVVCTFAGTLNTGLRALMTQNSGGLTGGSSPTVSVAHTTLGLPQETLSISAGIPITWDVSGPHVDPFAGAVTAWYVTSTNACRLQARILTA